MRAAVVGVGAVGARIARQLLSSATIDTVLIADQDPKVSAAVARSLGAGAEVVELNGPASLPDVDVLVLASPPGTHVTLARAAVLAGIGVVSASDSVPDVEGLLRLDDWARERNTSVAVGAGLMPGLTCVLAKHGAALFDEVAEIHVAKAGTGGPSCAIQHHRALSLSNSEYHDGQWSTHRGGSGRVLRWFPDPVASRDCYRALMPDPLLLHRAFPETERITARVAATRRDRLTMGIPMLRPPHRPEGGVGAIRVELWGSRNNQRDVLAYGAVDRPGVAAGAVAALTATWMLEGRLRAVGAAGLAELVEPVPFLAELATRGVKTAVFEGETAWKLPAE